MAPTYDLVSSARTEINELTLITTTKIARKKKKRQTWPGDVVAIKLLDGDGVVDDLGEHLHLLQIFGAEVTLLGGLQILQQLLVVDRALEGVAGPLAKGLLNGLADGVLAHNVLLVSFGRHQSLLQVLLSADFLATHNQLQGEIPHKPHELGEVEGQLAKILSHQKGSSVFSLVVKAEKFARTLSLSPLWARMYLVNSTTSVRTHKS